MNEMYDVFKKISFSNYDPPEHLSEQNRGRFKDSVIMMLEMRKLINKSIDVVKNTEVPFKLVAGLNDTVDEYIKLKNQLDEVIRPKENFDPSNVYNRIRDIHNNFFEPSSSSRTMMYINAINNYEIFFEEKSVNKIDQLNKELDEKSSRVDQILQKLEKPSAEKVLSQYAHEYEREEVKNNKISVKWIGAGLISIVSFIILTIISVNYKWFPSKLMLISESGKPHEIINIPMLVTKILLASLTIFLIVFCFKQYSIYKHLAVVNQQKKNAFNSYVLFEAAIGENDKEAKKVLLMSLAKTIHESINTGFISAKQFDPPLLQNFDIGKIN